MAAPSNTIETRYTANIQQMEQALQKLQRINAQAASNVAAAHARAVRQSQSAWANANIGRALQQQMAGVGSQLKQYAGLIAGMFAGREAIRAADTYSRFSNALKVAGLEGAALNQVQDALYQSAIKNGIALEPLGKLYGRAAQSAKELGASQADLLKFTNGVTSALRVSGTSTEEASGALLQLAQLLAGGVVHAEEFNSVNEGARPILEAVARGNEKYGGSVAKLRAQMLEGKVTSKAFFEDFLAGSASLEAQAAKAPLTVAASMQNLQTALVRYIGEANETWSITAKITFALKAMADNFDVLVESVMVLGGVYAATFIPALGRAAAGLAIGTAATVRSTVASVADTVALISRTAAIHNVSRAQVAATLSARALGTALAFFGGPVGLAIMAVGAAVAYLGVSSAKAALETSALSSRIEGQVAAMDEAEKAAAKKRVETGTMTTAEQKAAIATASLTGEAHKLTKAYYMAAAGAKALALQQARLDMIGANKDQRKAREGYEGRLQRELAAERGRNTPVGDPMDRRAGIAPQPLSPEQIRRAKARAFNSEEGRLWQGSVRVNQARVDDVRRIEGLSLDEYGAAPTTPAADKKKTGGKKASDNSDASAAAIEQAEKTYRQAILAGAETAEQRHNQMMINLAADRDEELAAIERRVVDGDITKASAAKVKALLESTYQQNVANEMAEFGNAIADRQNQITKDLADASADKLRLEAANLEGMAEDSRDLRKKHAYQRQALAKHQQADDDAFRVEQDLLALQRQKAGLTAEEVKQLRDAAQANRDATKRAETGQLERDQKRDAPKSVAGQLDEYARSFGTMNEQLGAIAQGGIDSLTTGLADAVMGAGSLQEAFGNMAQSMIRNLIEMAARFAIFEAIGGVIGVKGLGKASLTGAGAKTGRNAMGTDNWRGGWTTLNESGQEAFYLPRGAQVIPNNILKGFAAPQSGGNRSSVTNINTTVNANDAVLTDWVEKRISQANMGAVMLANKATQQNISKRNQNALGPRR